jgi:hypothetical protein
LESLEAVFHQDLNGDGVVGPTVKVIQTDGSTSLTEVGNLYFYLDGSSGTGPELKYSGTNVTAGEFNSWIPIGAIQTTNGYDVAWKNAGTGLYTVWTTNSNGNFTGCATGGSVSSTSVVLESLEPVFGQDLNSDGMTGLYAAPGATLQISTTLASASSAATIGAGATLALAAADSSSVIFSGSTGTLRLDHSSTFSGTIFGFTGNGTLSGSDQIDLRDVKYSSVKGSFTNGALTVTDGTNAAKLNFNGPYTLANFKFVGDGAGGTLIYDPPATSASQSPSETSGTASFGEQTFGSNLALLTTYIASTFGSTSPGVAKIFDEIAQSNQSFMSIPKHT